MKESHVEMDSHESERDLTKNNLKNTKNVLKKPGIIKLLGTVIVTSLSITMVYQTIGQIQKAAELDQQIAIATEKESDAQAKKEMLQSQVELLNNDEYVAKLARSEYYLSKPGEIIFSLPKELDVSQVNDGQ